MSSVRGPVIAGNFSRSRAMIAVVSSTESVVCVRYAIRCGSSTSSASTSCLGLDEHDRAGDLAHRALDLLVAGVADEHDRVAVGGELDRLAVDLRDQRAGRVDRPQAARLGIGVDGGRHAVGGEDGDRALGDLVAELVDEDGAALARAARPRACCGRSPCARRRARRAARARARRSGRRGRRRRSSRAARRAGASRGRRALPPQCTNELEHGLAGQVERALADGREVVAALVPALVRPLDQVDRRARRGPGTACGRR